MINKTKFSKILMFSTLAAMPIVATPFIVSCSDTSSETINTIYKPASAIQELFTKADFDKMNANLSKQMNAMISSGEVGTGKMYASLDGYLLTVTTEYGTSDGSAQFTSIQKYFLHKTISGNYDYSEYSKSVINGKVQERPEQNSEKTYDEVRNDLLTFYNGSFASEPH